MPANALKKVLYISWDGMTDPLGQSQVIPYLSGLAHLGHHITIVSAEKEKQFGLRGKIISAQLKDDKIEWHPVKYLNRPSGIATWLTYRRLKKMCLAEQQKINFDIVHCRSYLPALIGQQMKKKYATKFLFDMRGFWVDERAEGGIWDMKNPVFKLAFNFFKKKEKQFLKESDAIVSLTERAKKKILSWKELNFAVEKISVIPCCVDLDLFSPDKIEALKREELKTKLQLENTDLILIYAGSLGTWYMVEEMVQFFKHMLKQSSGAVFLIITPDSVKHLHAFCEENGMPLESLRTVAAQREEMPALLSIGNAGIFFIKNSFSKIASSPTKMSEMLAMGLPLICNSGIGDVDEILKQTKSGLIVDKFSDSEYERATDGLPFMLENSRGFCRKAAQDFFSLESGIMKYHQIYSSL